MSEMKVFEHSMFGNLRIVDHAGAPWFVAMDVAKALGYENPAEAIRDHCKKVNKINHHSKTLPPTPPVNILIIPEGDIYRLVMRSNLPDAERFEVWVMDEVLPSIMKTGGYMVDKPEDTPESIMARAVLIAQDTIKRLEQRTVQLEKKVEIDAPKVAFADSISVAQTSILVGEFAKLVKQSSDKKIGQNRLFEWLRDNGYIHKIGSQRNLPTQKSIDMGVMCIKEGTRMTPDGVSHITRTPKITGKGQIYFMTKIVSVT